MATPALRTVNRDIPNLSFRAEFSPSTIDVDKRTVELIWTTGARVLRGFWESYYEELSLDAKHVRMDRLSSGSAPLLNVHNSRSLEDVIGVVVSARLDKGGKTGSATVRFDSGVLGEEVFRKVREGILRSVSVGYRVYKMSKIEDGETTTPVYRAVDWEPYEISVVPVGADAGAVMRSAGTTVYPCIFEERAMEDDDDVKTNIPPAAQPPAPPAAAVSAEQVRTEERARINRIQTIGRALKRPDAEIQSAIDTGVSLEAFRAAAQDKFADESTLSFGKISAGEDARDKWVRGAASELLWRAGVAKRMSDAGKTLADVGLEAQQPREFRGLRMADIARSCLERSGIKVSGLSQMELFATALTQRSGGASSTGDFPVLLEVTVNKSLDAGYQMAPVVWPRLCRTGSVSDFKPSSRYKKGSFGVIDSVNEHGEFARKAIPDGKKETISAGTKGNIIAITRKALINDDLGAFVGLAADFGESVALTMDTDMFALLALNGGLGPAMNDGLTLFHATHANIGTGSALTVAGLDSDRVLMGSQKDPSGNRYITPRPSTLLVPLSLGGQARVINQSQYDPDAVNKLQIANKVAGLFRDVIDVPNITGTRRYLFSDQAPTLEMVFLDGVQQPYLESKEGWDVDGKETKVRIDYGVGAIDFRGAATNAGA